MEFLGARIALYLASTARSGWRVTYKSEVKSIPPTMEEAAKKCYRVGHRIADDQILTSAEMNKTMQILTSTSILRVGLIATLLLVNPIARSVQAKRARQYLGRQC